MKKRNLGFTLIELMVVMAIIAVLAVLFIGAITIARNTAKETTNRSNGKTLQVAIEAYFTKMAGYPAQNTVGTMQAAPTFTTFAAAASTLGVTLSNEPTGCTAAWAGGGRVVASSTAATVTTPALNKLVNYVIIPADAACGADQAIGNIITGP